jgi:hypothetical protein
MPGRERLHSLVDSLPEGALEPAQMYLEAIQTWPPKRPERPIMDSFIEKFRGELERKREKFLRGSGTGFWARDRNNKITGSFGNTEHNWETGVMTVRTFRVHRDFPMEITEQLRMKDNDETLEYEFHISGVGNEHAFHIEFQANRE